MAQAANVRSVEAIKDFKIALINFAEEARVALSSAEMDLNHTHNWLERDQLAYWKSQVKRSQEALAQAKAELFRRRLSQSKSDVVSDSDQKEAVREAQKRLRHAEEKVERVKRWVPILQHATMEYHMHSQPLGDSLSGSLTGSIAVLERMIAALEGYLTIAAPEAPVIAPSGGASAGAATGVQAGTGSSESSGVNPEPAEEEPETPVDVPRTPVGEEASPPAPAEQPPPRTEETETGSGGPAAHRDGLDAGAAAADRH